MLERDDRIFALRKLDRSRIITRYKCFCNCQWANFDTFGTFNVRTMTRMRFTRFRIHMVDGNKVLLMVDLIFYTIHIDIDINIIM